MTARRFQAFLKLAGIGLLAAAPAQVQAASRVGAMKILDPSTGEIDGKQALAMYAVRYEGLEAVEVLDPPSCVVRMVKLPREDDGTERSHPCGTWFLEDLRVLRGGWYGRDSKWRAVP